MKNKLKRALTLGLAFAMTLSMCACGKKDGDGGNSGGLFGGGSKNDAQAASASLAKENVYRLDEITLKDIPTDSNIMTTVIKDDKLVLLLSRYDYNEETYESTEHISLYTCNMDGSNVDLKELEMPETVQHENAEDPAFDAYNTSDYYSGYTLAENGTIYGIKNHYDNWSGDNNWKSETHYSICAWDTDGKLLMDVPMEGVMSSDDNWCYVDRLFEEENGGVAALIRGEETTLYRTDKDGKLLDNKMVPAEIDSVLTTCETMVPMQNGNLFLVYHDEENYEKSYYGELDLKAMTMTEKKELPSQVMTLWNYSLMTSGLNSELIFTTGNGLYQYKPGDAEPSKMLDYVNSDLFVTEFTSIQPIDSNSFFGVFRENWDEGLKAGTFTYVKPEDIQDKAVVVLAGQWVNYEVKKRVIDFNKGSQTTKIVIKDYSEYNTYDDYNAGITKLNNDIITGGMPDILCIDDYNSLPVENYIAKGLIADIGKLIKEDPELSQVEFMQNVFDAYSVDGTLYYVVPGFEVYTMAAKEKLVGGRDSWTMKDMQEVLSKMEPEATAFGTDMTRSTFLYMMLRYCGAQFVDFATGECKFNSQDFIDMLEYAKNFPEQINYDDDYWMNYDWQAEQAKYREEKTLLYNANLYNFQFFAEILNGYFGEPVKFIGFPTESGKGSYLMTSGTYVLSSKSAHQQEAWEFVKYYLSEEYQDEVSYFPVRKDIFMEKSKQALERPFWEDENGNIQYYDNTFYLNGEEIVLEPLNQQQLDQVIEFIGSVDNRYYSNDEIQKIIDEEAAAYFQGQKSAADVAAVIQSRVQLYVDETR